jgi:hypothetical protein
LAPTKAFWRSPSSYTWPCSHWRSSEGCVRAESQRHSASCIGLCGSTNENYSEAPGTYHTVWKPPLPSLFRGLPGAHDRFSTTTTVRRAPLAFAFFAELVADGNANKPTMHGLIRSHGAHGTNELCGMQVLATTEKFLCFISNVMQKSVFLMIISQ